MRDVRRVECAKTRVELLVCARANCLHSDATTRFFVRCRYGPGKWRLIQRDPVLNKILHTRSNVDLKDKWRNLYPSGLERSGTPTPREQVVNEEQAPVASTSGKATQSGNSGQRLKKRRVDDSAGASAVDVESDYQFDPSNLATNEAVGEAQRATREAQEAADALQRALKQVEQFEREAWEAEKLASELITEAVRQKNAAEAGDVVEILGAAATEDVDDLDGPDSIGLQ